MRARTLVTVVAALVLGVAVFGSLAADAANPPSFSAVVNPLAQLPAAGVLDGTSCPSASSCVAVGLDIGYQPLTLAGDPSSWGNGDIRPVTLGAAFNSYGPDSSLVSVSCTSSTFCVAVGHDGNGQPLVVAGDPATWTQAQATEITLGNSFGAHGPSSVLASVTCTSASSCVAVGTDGNSQPIVLAGDPATWTSAQVTEITVGAGFGLSGSLDGVSCTSASSCVAVGYDAHSQPLVLAGDPASWGVAQAHEIVLGSALAFQGSLYGVACTSASACLAVGDDGHGQPLTLAGDPASWGAAQAHEVTLDHTFGSGGSLFDVTCPSASSCVAVGRDGGREPLIVSGDPGTTWSQAQAQEIGLDTPFGGGGELASIACTSSSTCVATGIDANSQPLVLSGDPSTWSATQALEIPLTGVKYGVETYPTALTCTSSTSCLELGVDYGFIGSDLYRIEGNPGSWGSADAVEMTGLSPGSYFNSNTCPTPTFCVAVGQDGLSEEPLVLTGDPSTWDTAGGSTLALDNSFGSYGSLEAVACTSTTSCVAVGQDANREPFVVTGNPATWTAADAKEITIPKKLHSFGNLVSVTCTTATACVAVGYDGSHQQPLVLSGDPASWASGSAKQVTMNSTLGYSGELSSVACTSSTYCVAVGDSGGKAFKPLVLRGNPATWTAKQGIDLVVPASQGNSVQGSGYSAGAKAKGYLMSVSCTAQKYCVVAGGDRGYAPIYLAGNPGSWKAKGHFVARPTITSSLFVEGQLTTTSCAATACFAGGVANGGDLVASITGG